MEGDKIIICRLCLKMCKTGYKNIDKSTRKTLNFLLLWMNLDITHEPVMCTRCQENFRKCLDFKTKYLLKTNSTYVKNERIDLTDLKLDPLCVKTEDSASSISSNNICAFCMELVNVDSSVLLKNEANDVMTTLEQYFPEMGVNITEDSITCTSCYKSMQIMVSFINSCVDVEKKVKEYCNIEGTNSDGQIKLTTLLNFTFKDQLISFDIQEENVVNDYNQLENKSGTEIKFEDCVKVEEQELSYIKKEPDVKVEEGNNDRSTTLIEQDAKINMERTIADQSCSENSLRRHIFNNQEALKIKLHACKLCLYRTNAKGDMRQHILTHKSPFEVTMHKCELCAFQTKYKGSLTKHMLFHKSSTEALMHTCNICAFQTKYKSNIKRHMFTHKSTSEVEMLKCDKCSYQTKYKESLQLHMLVHRNASEMKKFVCDKCSFQSKRKDHLKTHMLVHKNISKVTRYKCETCTFQTKTKRYICEHMLTHKNITEVTMHKCKICAFESLDRTIVKRHMLTHQSASAVRMFTCSRCPFQSIYKRSLKQHMLTHKGRTKITLHKCKMCAFQSIDITIIKSHMLTHKSASEVKV